ncbi:putative sodium-coupled neutral amino acid transporter 10 [Leguminivora glycinivorella]|uniref:putative sodium-coupled neutral amino acid transporter 10 n=1 Tax=Leguminivora glycinivorella TaxID=1035111 RepID=UPI00200C51F2|nr:putative sodium-coupled neutral amino acid transporter 10 [Leguminivora glycinivorella]
MGTTGQSITLANSIIGVGILAMPFCFQKCGVLLATLILLSMGLVSRLCCHFLLKSALLARRRNFEFLAFHVFGSAGKMAVELGIIGFLMGTCIAYFVVVGDLGPQIIAKMFNINQSDILRTSIMVIVSLVCVLPLGLLRNVDSLSNVSAATIGFYFCLVIKVISEATSQLLTSEWGMVEHWKPEGVLQCVPIFSMALFCQTQLFEIFESMPTLSLEKMNVVTKNAINICTAVYFTLGLFGYIAFNKHDISGNILMSLSPTMASDVIKLGFVMSLAFSFPLIIFPCRASLYSFLYRKVHPSQHDHIINHSIPEPTFRAITVAIVAAALVISLLIPNIELVLGLVGSTIGVLICVVFPTACFVNVTFKNTNERVLAKVVLILGLGIMILGTYANLQAAENAPDKYDTITQERIDKIVEDFFQARQLEDGGMIKAAPKVDINKVSDEDAKHSKEKVADSEVQPPNPVPPESQPDDAPKEPPRAEIVKKKPEIAQKQEKAVLKEIKPDTDRVSETHPKNLKITEEKLSNGDTNKVQKIDSRLKEEIKQMSNQQKIDLLKQAQLAETIKQHGEEQKELIKEQKEILDNIIKTKQEIQQDKNEAKKIAVESIQKIANVAIQSLSAVSEQPSAGKIEPENTANEAVKKIADVAVEAIKEIKDKPIETLPLLNNIAAQLPEVKIAPVQNSVNEVKQNKPIAQNPVQNFNPSKSQDTVLENSGVKVDVNNNNILPPVQNVNIEKSNNAAPDNKNIELNKPQEVINVAPIVQNPVLENNNPLENKQPLIPSNNNVPIHEAHQLNSEVLVEKTHSHSPDEPQSYKQGEDAQTQPDAQASILNVPLPLAMNGNKIKSEEIKQEVVDKSIHIQNDAKQPNTIENNEKSRQKREAVDCLNKATLRAEDKEVCKSIDSPVSPEILPNVDLNELPKLPVDLHMVHQIRSLKSYDEEKRR